MNNITVTDFKTKTDMEKRKLRILKSVAFILCLLVLMTLGACNRSEGNKDDMDGVLNKNASQEKAHVILLAGQSNASGISHIEFLKKHTSEEKIKEYTTGYNNIRIYYCVDKLNVSSEFVPVALGQGRTKDTFGPEVGIAEYLNEHYPSEKFYIIKVASSGSGIAADWQEGDDTYRWVMTEIKNGFLKLEAQDLNPEWFATCWMQGEGDSWDIARAENYYNLESDLMNRLQTFFEKYASQKGVSLIDAGISDFKEWAYYEKVNEAKKKYASENKMNFYLDTMGAGLTYNQDNNDYAHFDAASMIELGKMFGEKVGETAVIHGYVNE